MDKNKIEQLEKQLAALKTIKTKPIRQLAQFVLDNIEHCDEIGAIIIKHIYKVCYMNNKLMWDI